MARSRIDVGLLFATRITRLFAYGALSVVLALYLAAIGLDEGRIGLLLAGGYFAAPFLLAGGLKIVYDLLLYLSLIHISEPTRPY